jgi:hypothetical protein
MNQITQSLTQGRLLNSGFGFARMDTDAGKAARKPRGRVKSNSPIRFMLEMQRSNRLETPIWILLAAAACVALGLSL